MLSSPHLLSPGMHWSMKPNNWGRKLCLKEKTLICLGKLRYLQKGEKTPILFETTFVFEPIYFVTWTNIFCIWTNIFCIQSGWWSGSGGYRGSAPPSVDYFEKDVFVFEQIYFVLEQIYFVTWTNIFCNLNKYIS